MKLAIINGSPKHKDSNSSILVEHIVKKIDFADIFSFHAHKAFSELQLHEIAECQSLLLVFPLYVDAIPSNLFRNMIQLSSYFSQNQIQLKSIYAIVNNGFYEGHQCQTALDIVKNWCVRSKLHYQMGIAQGAGEVLGFTKGAPLGKGPSRNLGNAIDVLAEHIRSETSHKDILFSPNFPHFAWKLSADHGFWLPRARKNGLRVKDIKRRCV